MRGSHGPHQCFPATGWETRTKQERNCPRPRPWQPSARRRPFLNARHRAHRHPPHRRTRDRVERTRHPHPIRQRRHGARGTPAVPGCPGIANSRPCSRAASPPVPRGRCATILAADGAFTTMAECEARGWNEVDIVFVNGDAYIDYPSFATTLSGRGRVACCRSRTGTPPTRSASAFRIAILGIGDILAFDKGTRRCSHSPV